jgi:hypothetical protein
MSETTNTIKHVASPLARQTLLDSTLTLCFGVQK